MLSSQYQDVFVQLVPTCCNRLQNPVAKNCLKLDWTFILWLFKEWSVGCDHLRASDLTSSTINGQN